MSLPQRRCATPWLWQKVYSCFFALHAEAGLQGSGRIIKPGVNDFAVTRRGGGAEFLFAFEDDDGEAAHCQFTTRRQSYHPGTDDDRVDIRHGPFPSLPMILNGNAIRRVDPAQWVD